MLSKEEKSRLREAVLEYLAERPTAEFSVMTITRMVQNRELVDFGFVVGDAAEALAVLEGYGFVKSEYPKLSPIKQFQATSEGVLFYERGE